MDANSSEIKEEQTSSASHLEVLAEKCKDPQVLAELAQSKYKHIRICVAKNLYTAAETLAYLSKDSNGWVRFEVALNQNTPGDALKNLAGDINNSVRHNAVANPCIPQETLRKLSRSKEIGDRRGVALNPNIPLDIIKFLANDKKDLVRYNIVKNPSAPSEIIKKMYENEVQNDTLTTNFASAFAGRGVLAETELSALVATFGEGIGKVIAKSGPVAPNTTLAKQLLKLGIKNQETKRGGYHE